MYVKFTLNHGKTADLQDSREFQKFPNKSLKYCPKPNKLYFKIKIFKSDCCFGQKRQETPRKSEKHFLIVIRD